LDNTPRITDWITLTTSSCQWHLWLKQDTIPKSLVSQQSTTAIEWLIQQFKFITPCSNGMNNNTIQFHLVLHQADAILDHRFQQNFNSSSFVESAHRRPQVVA
jgi:hypothetical protein